MTHWEEEVRAFRWGIFMLERLGQMENAILDLSAEIFQVREMLYLMRDENKKLQRLIDSIVENLDGQGVLDKEDLDALKFVMVNPRPDHSTYESKIDELLKQLKKFSHN